MADSQRKLPRWLFQAFAAALDAPTKRKPRLEKLLKTAKCPRVTQFGQLDKLRAEHQLDAFDCGVDDLNRFLKRQAWTNQQVNSVLLHARQAE